MNADPFTQPERTLLLMVALRSLGSIKEFDYWVDRTGMSSDAMSELLTKLQDYLPTTTR